MDTKRCLEPWQNFKQLIDIASLTNYFAVSTAKELELWLWFVEGWRQRTTARPAMKLYLYSRQSKDRLEFEDTHEI